MEEDNTLYLQLHKLSYSLSSSTPSHTSTNNNNANIEEEEEEPSRRIEQVLEALWQTRKTGLKPHQKSHFDSLLNLPSLHDLDPPQWQRSRVSQQVKVSGPFLPAPVSAPEISSSMWPRQDNATNHLSHNNAGNTMPTIFDPALPHMAPVHIQQVDGPPDNLAILPRLKSMTWNMENRNSTPANRVAVINLKLQDYTKSPSREMGVKFQLSRDTRSHVEINDLYQRAVFKQCGACCRSITEEAELIGAYNP